MHGKQTRASGSGEPFLASLTNKVLQRTNAAARASRSLWPSPLSTGTLARPQTSRPSAHSEGRRAPSVRVARQRWLHRDCPSARLGGSKRPLGPTSTLSNRPRLALLPSLTSTTRSSAPSAPSGFLFPVSSVTHDFPASSVTHELVTRAGRSIMTGRTGNQDANIERRASHPSRSSIRRRGHCSRSHRVC
jgi:hypothetical protein